MYCITFIYLSLPLLILICHKGPDLLASAHTIHLRGNTLLVAWEAEAQEPGAVGAFPV